MTDLLTVVPIGAAAAASHGATFQHVTIEIFGTIIFLAINAAVGWAAWWVLYTLWKTFLGDSDE